MLQETKIDTERFRLRTFIEALESELETRDEDVALADVAGVLDGNPRAVYFRHVGPECAELVGNVAGSRSRIARAFDVPVSQLRSEILRRLQNVPFVQEIPSSEAPVHQSILTGAEADLTSLPVHLQHGLDGAPYISASIDYAVDEQTGWTNSGFRRLMLRGKQHAGADLVAPSDLRTIYTARAAKGERLPVTYVVGCHPIDQVSATLRLPGDELGLVASLRGGSIAAVRGVTNGVLVPADAEYTLEGYLDERGHVEPEGPYGEFLGYYGEVKRNPVFHLTAITSRRDALFQTSTISGVALRHTDTAQLAGLRTEIMVWRALQGAVREPLDVCATGSSGGMMNVRISLRQRVPGEARNAIAAAFGSLANVKNVFVVDPDIDIFSDEQMDWALATRFQANRDLVVGESFRGLPLDPSLNGSRLAAKTGFDLTWPFGADDSLGRRVPQVLLPEAKRFATINDALRDGPKFFGELMSATGSRDGREIVRELDTIRSSGALNRDDVGRYFIMHKQED